MLTAVQVIRNMDTPISLTDLHIICHLEDYPLHHLAKLSYPVRRRLLQNLPACDIIELENTCVADGIGDLESEVWKQSCVCQSYYDKNLQMSLGPLTRQPLLDSVSRYLFRPVDGGKNIRKWLFSVSKCLGISDLTSFTSVACDDLDRLVPRHYAALFDHSITTQSEFHARVVTALNKASFKPAKIDASGGFSIDMNSRYMNDLSVLLSAVDTVELPEGESQPLSIIKAICMSESPMLRSLAVLGDDFTQRCVSLLLEASVVSLEKLYCTVPTSDSGRGHLIEFLSSQANMKELYLFTNSNDYELSDGNSCKRNQHWVSCMGKLMMQPEFEHFQVQLDMNSSRAGVTQCAVFALLNLFLSAPASMPRKIIGTYFNVESCECYSHKEVRPSIVGNNSLEYKEMTFCGNTDESVLDPILKCLSNFEVQLKYLSFGNYALKDVSSLSSLFSVSTFTVREVSLYYVEFPGLTSESDFHCLDGLLSKPSLKIFEFTGIGGDDFEHELTLVSNALTIQATVGTLESFIYEDFEESLYGLDLDGVQEFVRALLCLPQFLQLNLTFPFPSGLADLANELWVECANGRTLRPPPPNCKNSLLETMLGLQALRP